MLAQQWLYGPHRIKTPRDHELERFLKLPSKFNPRTTAAELNRLAERIVFTDDVPSLLYEMHDNKQLTMRGVLSTARLPYDVFWLEYATLYGLDAENKSYREQQKKKHGKEPADDVERANFGALFRRIGEAVQLHVVCGLTYTGDPDTYCTLTHVLQFDQWPPTPVRSKTGRDGFVAAVLWSGKGKPQLANYEVSKEGIATYQIINDYIDSVILELVFGCFLVTQPKVFTEEKHVPSERLRKQRERKNKPPLLDYRKVHLRIGKKHTRYIHDLPAQRTAQRASLVDTVDTESDDAIIHRRYHRVMGHFRHYLNAEPPRTVWIEAHYRGDPALGVTFTERDVTR